MVTQPQRTAVRVIKRQQRDFQTQSPPDPSSAAREPRTNRALAVTVSSWIEEFRRRRQIETAALLQFRLLAGIKVLKP